MRGRECGYTAHYIDTDAANYENAFGADALLANGCINDVHGCCEPHEVCECDGGILESYPPQCAGSAFCV